MAKGPPAADRRNDMPPLVGQLALRVMAAIPCMDIDLAVGLIMFVRDRHRVGLDPVADREPLKAAAQLGRQLRHLVIVEKRTEERSVGKEGVGKGRSGWSP